MKPTTKSAGGTSFHGSIITTSKNKLVEVLGEPGPGDGGQKVKNEWVMETEDGDVFTIYDWKEPYFRNNQSISWHIGGHSRTVTAKAAKELAKVLK